MSGILLFITFLSQGMLVQQGGTVTGVLLDEQNLPVSGIRMAAIARSEALLDPSAAAPMAGLAITDEKGRFTLQNVPPGRYVVAAGRLDRQTYYPGTLILSDAAALTIASGSTIREINFVLNTTSVGRAGGTWARLAAYQDILWPEGSPETPHVLLDGRWYELLSIDNLSSKELIDYSRRIFAKEWQKRFEEDMVEILGGLGRPSTGTVSLRLHDLENNLTLTRSSLMNAANRSALMRAKGARPSR